MKLFLISDNHDTLTGMRLAGIEGVVVHDEDGVKKAIENAVNSPETGMLLITDALNKLCSAYILDLKLKLKSPLIVIIPDRHTGMISDTTISDYIRQSLGG